MLFNSYSFLFVYLPLALIGFYALRYIGWRNKSVAFLMLASFAFYAYWKPADVFLLLASVVFNFVIAGQIATRSKTVSKLLLVAALCVNIGLLVYYKYFDFLASNIEPLFGATYVLRHIVMPIGISFFTFTQVAYLVDCYQARSYEQKFSRYGLFVTLFPHLIAGPIIHHAQMRPQFERVAREPVEPGTVIMGVIIFVMGLAKKVLLADNIAVGADAMFHTVDAGTALSAASAWGGALAYTFQIYFDFSGYSDMAIGLALLFGIRLPLNFNSPYKSRSIIEFWRRWHMTLSTWLRDYIYIPLGGNRGGEFMRLRNVFLTFFIGGIWHGAGWTFVIWGAMHGTFVVANHLIRHFIPGLDEKKGPLISAAKQLATLLFVILAWVFFRATTLDGAMLMLHSMSAGAEQAPNAPVLDLTMWGWIALGAAIAFFAPNTQEIVSYTDNLKMPLTLPSRLLVSRGGQAQALSPAIPVVCGLLFAVVLAHIWRPSIFIYFNF